MVNIGLIGTGYWGKMLQQRLERCGTVVFACSGRDAEEYISKIAGVDWVVVATPNQTHYGIVNACLSQRVNVFCEKPLTANRTQSEELHRYAEKNGAALYVDDVFLFRDETKELAERVRGSQIRSMGFIYKKHGSFKDTLFNNWAYHDLSILFHLFKNMNYTNLRFARNDTDRKEFAFSLGDMEITFSYDRLSDQKDRRILVDGKMIDYTHPTNDALEDMLTKVLSGEADFNGNKMMCMAVDEALEALNAFEPKK